MFPFRSLYEQALESRRGAEKSSSSDKVVTLRKGTINDIRNKIFEKKQNDFKPVQSKAPKKHIITDKNKVKNAKEEPLLKMEKKDEMKKVDPIESLIANVKEINETLISVEVKNDKEPTQRIQTDEKKDDEAPKKTKRQSFINDFAALEKTYRMLGIYKEPVLSDEETKSEKKRHASEGKTKKKNKTKSKAENKKTTVDQKSTLKKDEDEPAISIPKFDAGQNIAKRNFFQEMINEKKVGANPEPVLSGPKMRRKTNLVANFEEKTRETAKRDSLIKEDIKVQV